MFNTSTAAATNMLTSEKRKHGTLQYCTSTVLPAVCSVGLKTSRISRIFDYFDSPGPCDCEKLDRWIGLLYCTYCTPL